MDRTKATKMVIDLAHHMCGNDMTVEYFTRMERITSAREALRTVRCQPGPEVTTLDVIGTVLTVADAEAIYVAAYIAKREETIAAKGDPKTVAA